MEKPSAFEQEFPRIVVSRKNMEPRFIKELHGELDKDPYFLHRWFRTELIGLSEKYDDLDHDFKGGSDLQEFCYSALRVALDMKIPDIEIPGSEAGEVEEA